MSNPSKDTNTDSTIQTTWFNGSNRSRSSEKSSNNINNKTSTTRVWTRRFVFLLSLSLIVGGLVSISAFFLVSRSEYNQAEIQFEAIADHALQTAYDITLRKRDGAKSLANIVSYAYPDAESWPFVNIHGFEAIAQSIIETASTNTMGMAPLVPPEQLVDFEDYAYNVSFPENHYSNTTGIHPQIGKAGVYGFFESNLTTYLERGRDGWTEWGSSYNSIWPFLMHSSGPPILMLNLHSVERFGRVIDEMHACADSRASNEQNKKPTELDLSQCSILSDMTKFAQGDGSFKCGAIILQPIYPANDPNQLSGLISSSMAWVDVLEELFTNDVSGVDCVVETETAAHTFTVNEGEAMSISGEGDGYHQDADPTSKQRDYHDRRYTSYGQSIQLTSPEVFQYTSAHYKLTLYPNEQFFEQYQTENPTIALVGSLCIVVFTSLIFFLYDFFVRKEFHHRKAVLKAKREYVRFISHECRTPLHSICMGSQLAQDNMLSFSRSADRRPCPKDILKEKINDWVNLNRDILRNAQSAVYVLNDLLNYDKVETGTLALELTIVPIWQLIENTANAFELSAAAKNIRLNVDYSRLLQSSTNIDVESEKDKRNIRNLPPEVLNQKVVGDTERITQVLRNFLSNAIKFTPDGGNITVQMTWLRPNETATSTPKTPKDFLLYTEDEVSLSQNGWVQVDVIDSGAGLTKEQVDQVFGEGVQFNVNNLQCGQGSGLGLFISEGIAQKHGGQLAVASEGLGQGATFSMQLPVFDAPDSKIPEKILEELKQKYGEGSQDGDGASSEDVNSAHNSSETGDVEGERDSPLKILVVDDTPLNRKLLVRMLKNKGHTCDEAVNGLEAVKLVETAIFVDGNPYDVVLLDYEMPVCNGPTAAQKMRELGCSSFIAGVTGNLLPEDVHYFESQGANCVLPKPLNMHNLESQMAEYGVTTHNHDQDSC